MNLSKCYNREGGRGLGERAITINGASNKPDHKPIIKTTVQLSKQVEFIKLSGMAAISTEKEYYMCDGERNDSNDDGEKKNKRNVSKWLKKRA